MLNLSADLLNKAVEGWLFNLDDRPIINVLSVTTDIDLMVEVTRFEAHPNLISIVGWLEDGEPERVRLEDMPVTIRRNRKGSGGRYYTNWRDFDGDHFEKRGISFGTYTIRFGEPQRIEQDEPEPATAAA